MSCNSIIIAHNHPSGNPKPSPEDLEVTKKLIERRLVKLSTNNRGQKVLRLTEKGRIKLQEYKLSELQIIKPKKWDSKYRVIIFDIPQELHNERIRFRKKIKSLGFVMLQKSVFIFPYPCDDEIGDICGNLNISDFVDIIVAESPGFREAELRKIFNLAGWES